MLGSFFFVVWVIVASLFTIVELGVMLYHFDEFGRVNLATPAAVKDRFKTNWFYAISIYIMFALFNPLGFCFRMYYTIYKFVNRKKLMKCQECGALLEWMVRFGADQTVSGRSETLFNCPHCGSSWNAIYDEEGGKIEKLERHYFG